MTDREPSKASESIQQSPANREAVTPSGIVDSASAGSGPFTVLPTQFGRFRVLKLLGSGAMGTVYLAHDPEDERDIALKIPKDDLARDSALWERFQREARAVGDLNHDNICGMYEVGQIGTTHFIAMQYIVGRPLSDYISAETPPSQRQVASIIRRLARGLAHAHDRGVVHRDLKPANVMIDRRSEPVIMDFGLALRTDSKADVRATTSGMIVGSPAYMSPEQARGDHDKIGPWTDIYGLGVLFFELLTGSLPFRGSMISVLGQIATQPPPKPSSLRADADPQLESLCLKMLAKQPAQRPSSMVEVTQLLTDWLSRGSSPASDPRTANPTTDEATSQASIQPPEPPSFQVDDAEEQKQRVNTLLARSQTSAAIELLEKIVNLQDKQFAPLVFWGCEKLQEVRSLTRTTGWSPTRKWLIAGAISLLILMGIPVSLVWNNSSKNRTIPEPAPHAVAATIVDTKISERAVDSEAIELGGKVGKFINSGGVELANTKGLLKLDQDFTIEMIANWQPAPWQCFASNAAWPGLIPGVNVPEACGWSLSFRVEQNRPILDFTIGTRPGKEWNTVFGSVPDRLPNWTHLAVCRTDDKLTLFLNGDVIAMQSIPDLMPVESPIAVSLGGRKSGFWNHRFDGHISRFAMHQCSRFDNDASHGRFVNDEKTLVLLDFDHIEDGKLVDQTGRGHHGILLPDVTVIDRERVLSDLSTLSSKTKDSQKSPQSIAGTSNANASAKEATGHNFVKLLAMTPNGVESLAPLDCRPSTHRLNLNPKFDLRKSWLLSLAVRPFNLNGGSHQVFLWGDSRPGHDPLFIKLEGNSLSACVADTSANRLQCFTYKLPDHLFDGWINVKLVHDASKKEFEFYVNHRLIHREAAGITPTTDRPMPLVLGGTDYGDQRFEGEVSNFWLGNITDTK